MVTVIMISVGMLEVRASADLALCLTGFLVLSMVFLLPAGLVVATKNYIKNSCYFQSDTMNK